MEHSPIPLRPPLELTAMLWGDFVDASDVYDFTAGDDFVWVDDPGETFESFNDEAWSVFSCDSEIEAVLLAGSLRGFGDRTYVASQPGVYAWFVFVHYQNTAMLPVAADLTVTGNELAALTLGTDELEQGDFPFVAEDGTPVRYLTWCHDRAAMLTVASAHVSTGAAVALSVDVNSGEYGVFHTHNYLADIDQVTIAVPPGLIDAARDRTVAFMDVHDLMVTRQGEPVNVDRWRSGSFNEGFENEAAAFLWAVAEVSAGHDVSEVMCACDHDCGTWGFVTSRHIDQNNELDAAA